MHARRNTHVRHKSSHIDMYRKFWNRKYKLKRSLRERERESTQTYGLHCTHTHLTPSLGLSSPPTTITSTATSTTINYHQRTHLRKHMATSPPPGGYLQKPNLYLPSRSVSTKVKCSSCSLQGAGQQLFGKEGWIQWHTLPQSNVHNQATWHHTITHNHTHPNNV